jgi:outer membrane protein TolC
LQKESLALAESIQNKTLVKYKQGIASSLDLTQTQNQYLQQQGNYINAVFTLLSAKIALDKINNNLPDPNKTQNPK